MTSARRLLMLSAVFLAFFVVGAIFAYAPAEKEVTTELESGKLRPGGDACPEKMFCVVDLSDTR